MRHITQDEALLLREGIVSSLTRSGTLEEIGAGGLVFVFSGTVKTSYSTAATGVEHLGMKETYTFTSITVEDLLLSGAYDASGNEVWTDLGPGDLRIRYRDECFSVRVNPGPAYGQKRTAGRKTIRLPFPGKSRLLRPALSR